MNERITEEELVELEKFYDFGLGNGARLIAEIRRLRELVETACCIGRLGVNSYGDFVSRTNEFGDTDYKASECPELLEFLDPVDIDAPRAVKPEPPVTRFLLESEGKIIGRIVEANPND
jgi:hypothetical protein